MSISSAEARWRLSLGLYLAGSLCRTLCHGKMYETTCVGGPTACAYYLSTLGRCTDYCAPSLRPLISRSNVAMAANNMCNVAHLQAFSNTEVTRLPQSTTSRQASHPFVYHTSRRSVSIESTGAGWITALHSVFVQPVDLTTRIPRA